MSVWTSEPSSLLKEKVLVFSGLNWFFQEPLK